MTNFWKSQKNSWGHRSTSHPSRNPIFVQTYKWESNCDHNTDRRWMHQKSFHGIEGIADILDWIHWIIMACWVKKSFSIEFRCEWGFVSWRLIVLPFWLFTHFGSIRSDEGKIASSRVRIVRSNFHSEIGAEFYWITVKGFFLKSREKS